MPGSIFARPPAPGGMFGPRYGGVFGDADPLYSEMVARQVADQPGIGSRIADWYRNSTFVRPAVEGVQSALTLPGDVYSGAQPTMVPDTGQGSTSPQLADRAGELAGMLTLGAGAVPAEANALRMGIKAYHASPHDFDKFDMSKVGTGQGAQSYGHGIYAAESPGVSGRGGSYDREFTAKKMGQSDTTPQQEYILKRMGEGQSDLEIIKGMARDGIATDFEQASAMFDKVKANKASIYQVDIAADPEHFLDWDKPLSEQSPKVREAIKKSGLDAVMQKSIDKEFTTLKSTSEASGEDLYAALRDRAVNWREGEHVPLSEELPHASKSLHEAGISGIRYLDQGSRIAPQKRVQLERDLELAKLAGNESEIARLQSQLENPGTSNYVVFDDKLISVLKKYGLPISAAGAATLAQMHPGEAQAHDRR